MIVPMKKVCLVVQENTQNEALLKLRSCGVLHIEKTAPPESVAKTAEEKTKVENAISILSEIKVPKKKKNAVLAQQVHTPRAPGARRGRRATDMHGTEEQEPYSLEAVRDASRPSLPDYILSISREKKSLQERTLFLKKEISRIEPWGDFDPESVKELAELGQPLYFYELTYDALDSLDKDINYIKIGVTKRSVNIIVFDKELPASVQANIQPVALSEKSITAMNREIDEIKLEVEELDAKIHNLVERLPALQKEMVAASLAYEFDNAANVLEKVEEVPQNMGLVYLTGYVPAPDAGNLKNAAKENGWALSLADPAEDDEKVPTQLKNNKFVKLLNPVTDFLGIVPGYREMDISLWFLIFFCIFFGMIFGDAGYGILLLLGAAAGLIITSKKGSPSALYLLLILAISNTAWGIATCSWFGMEIQYVPQILKDISLSYLSTAKTEEVFVKQNQQIFCFSLGLIHMTIAHFKGIIRKIKSPAVLGEIGAIGMLLGMYNLVLFLVVSNDARSIPLLPVSLYLLAGGFVFKFFFAYYERSIGQSLMDSLKNIISVVFDIPNLFSDIMSYIRLWAVGLAGASIASTVNILAGPLLGNFLIFIGVILLVFGHGLNIILNVLSVVVHGVRLNTLEFSSHAGLSWSGSAYKPFAEKNSG